MKSYCLPGLLYAMEVISLTATSVHIFRALYKNFSACDSDSFKQMRQWLGLPSVSVLVESRRHRTFMDKLLDEPRFSALGNVFMSNLSRFLFFYIL